MHIKHGKIQLAFRAILPLSFGLSFFSISLSAILAAFLLCTSRATYIIAVHYEHYRPLLFFAKSVSARLYCHESGSLFTPIQQREMFLFRKMPRVINLFMMSRVWYAHRLIKYQRRLSASWLFTQLRGLITIDSETGTLSDNVVTIQQPIRRIIKGFCLIAVGSLMCTFLAGSDRPNS